MMVRLVSVVGMMVFAVVFGLTVWTPNFVEYSAKEFIKKEVLEATDKKIDLLEEENNGTAFYKVANKLINEHHSVSDQLKQSLKVKVREKTPDIIREIADLDSKSRDNYANGLETIIKSSIVADDLYLHRIEDFMKIKYVAVVRELFQDFRVFSFYNFLVFLMIFWSSLVKQNTYKKYFVCHQFFGWVQRSYCLLYIFLNETGFIP